MRGLSASPRAYLTGRVSACIASIAVWAYGVGMPMTGAGVAGGSPTFGMVGASVVALACGSVVIAAHLHARRNFRPEGWPG